MNEDYDIDPALLRDVQYQDGVVALPFYSRAEQESTLDVLEHRVDKIVLIETTNGNLVATIWCGRTESYVLRLWSGSDGPRCNNTSEEHLNDWHDKENR